MSATGYSGTRVAFRNAGSAREMRDTPGPIVAQVAMRRAEAVSVGCGAWEVRGGAAGGCGNGVNLIRDSGLIKERY